MNAFVESVKRLYIQNLITQEKVSDFYKKGKITKQEYDYITEKDGE